MQPCEPILVIPSSSFGSTRRSCFHPYCHLLDFSEATDSCVMTSVSMIIFMSSLLFGFPPFPSLTPILSRSHLRTTRRQIWREKKTISIERRNWLEGRRVKALWIRTRLGEGRAKLLPGGGGGWGFKGFLSPLSGGGTWDVWQGSGTFEWGRITNLGGPQ